MPIVFCFASPAALIAWRNFAIKNSLCSCVSATADRNDVLHSVRKLFTGLAIAALIAWKLIVMNAINAAINPAMTNTHQGMLMR